MDNQKGDFDLAILKEMKVTIYKIKVLVKDTQSSHQNYQQK